MKAFTERNPKVLGLTAVVIMAIGILAILFLNRSLFASGYDVTARFPNAAGIAKGTDVVVAGVKVGSVTSVKLHGNSVDATLSISHSVQLPHKTTAAIEVETLLGVVDVTLQPVSGWDHPLHPQAGTLITDTSVPTEFYQLQNTAHTLLSKSNAKALNSLIESLATITKGKQTQVGQIIEGLGKLTTTVDQRSGQVSQLIDSANTLSSTLAARDQQLISIVNNLNVVSTGLALHSQDLSNLITDVDQMATQTNSLVGQDSPALNSLLQSLHVDLTVVGQHQEDLAEGVSYLGGALKGFASIAYSGTQEVNWGNIYANPAALTNAYGVIGPCGALDQVLNEVLGPDPVACDAQTGPLPGAGSNTVAGGTGASTRTGTTEARAAPPSSRDRELGLGRRCRSCWRPCLQGGAGQAMSALADLLRTKVARFAIAAVVLVAAVFVVITETEPPATNPLHAVYAERRACSPAPPSTCWASRSAPSPRCRTWGTRSTSAWRSTRAPTSRPGRWRRWWRRSCWNGSDIELNPGYTGGASLAEGTTIPESRTSVPVSTDEVLKELQHTLNALSPSAVGNLVSNLATDLDGQGANLNKLISSAAGTVQLLANKGNDLGQLNGTLAQLTGALDTDTAQIESLLRQYDTVSTVIAQHQGQLGDAISQLAGASSSLVTLLVPNLVPLESDVGTVTQVGRTLDRNLDSVDEILQQGSNLFQGAARAYDPTYNWLDLNLELAPGVTGDYITGLIRDRLAGICRRIVANHATGLSASELTALTACANPASTFLRPAALVHPDHPQRLERQQRLEHASLRPAAEGPQPGPRSRAR